jgi:hypothetical protein
MKRNIPLILCATALMTMTAMHCHATTRRGYESLRQRMELSGQWHCDLGSIRLPSTIDESKLAPRNTNTLVTANLTRTNPYIGVMNYEREITLPKTMAGKRLRLIMERTKPSTLWIDGDSIGHEDHLQAPHIYLLPGMAQGKHRIKIRIDNSTGQFNPGVAGSHALAEATQTNWNGILGVFRIEALPATYIDKVDVYPNVKAHTALVRVMLVSDGSSSGSIGIEGYAWNTAKPNEVKAQKYHFDVAQKGRHELTYTVKMGEHPCLWSEYDPAMYRLNITCTTKDGRDNSIADFGMRDFSTQGNHFVINGTVTYLRGSHDGCVFPLTAYAPVDTAQWMRYFRIMRQYGFNHIRCHSWTPPEAAFEAADIMGFYIQCELPFWGTLDRKNTALNDYLMREGEKIIDAYGNHPSFTALALGNELWGDIGLMREWLNRYRLLDGRHLYVFGANNYLGFKGYQAGEDYYVTCRNGSDTDTTFATHVRSSFSFADAYQGGILNGLYPNTEYTYTRALKDCPIPVVSHESAQFQIYPDYAEIKKYTGVLYPYNYEIFRDRLKKNHLSDQAADYNKATKAFAALCYKADMELCMRTPGMGGSQILDIKDYPGQGSALVGLLDAFMDSKGAITSEAFRRFNAPVTVMAEFPTYCWNTGETMKGKVVVANYSQQSIEGKTLTVTLHGDRIIKETKQTVTAPKGGVNEVAAYSIPLTEVDRPTQLTLTIDLDGHTNEYPVWVYPTAKVEHGSVLTATVLTDSLLHAVEQGAKVLYVPRHQDIEEQSVGGLFTPDYWNYAMFKTISENNKKPVSPGTMSVLVNPKHPLFSAFPTEMHSDWQWWIISRNSRPMILDNTEADYRPIVQVVDNVERNHKLGIIFEYAIGKGAVLVCTCHLAAIEGKPEGRQLEKCIYDYMNSDSFRPQHTISAADFTQLFRQHIEQQKIVGEKNITTYEQ